MDRLEAEDPVDEVSYAYWRGLRDGYENASYELYVELGDFPRMQVYVIT